MGFFVGFVLTIALINYYENRPIYEHIKEIITLDASDILSFPIDAKIYCESGPNVNEYPGLLKKMIYACPRLVPVDNGNHVDCSGNGKHCYVEYDKLVSKQ